MSPLFFRKAIVMTKMKSASMQQATTNLRTYIDFGPDRVALLPDYFVCHPCKMHDEAATFGNSRATQSSVKRKCTASHVNFDIHATRTSPWPPQKHNERD